MGKPARERSLAESEAKAVAHGLRSSPRKLNLVAESIRGLSVNAALNALAFSPKKMAVDVRKALQSAVANAENNHQLDVDRLVVAEAYVGTGLVMKRFHARARGRGAGIRKPFSNLYLIVRERAEEQS
jgi:large subunit ribosomal protein L22